LTELYERAGAGYLMRGLAAAWVAFAIGGFLFAVLLKPYLRPTPGHFVGLLAVVELGFTAMMLVATLTSRPYHTVFAAWWRAGRPVDGAVRIWKMLGRLTVRWVYGWPLGVVTTALPTAIYCHAVIGLDLDGSATVFAAFVGAGGYAALLGSFTVDRYTTPARRDAAWRMPPQFEPDRARVPIARRLFAALLMISGTTGLLLSFGLSIGTGSLSRLALGLALTVCVTLTATLICTVMITGSTAGPVEDLLAAIRRIRAGDVRIRVPVISEDELGLVAANFNQMTSEVQHTRARIVTAADAERRRVERDLHDGAQQHLVLLRLKLGMLITAVERDPAAVASLSRELSGDLDRALVELRDLAHGIYPAALENEGLEAALRDAAGRAPIPTTLECDTEARRAPEIEAAVYFCCLEALQNAAKHAGEGARAAIRLIDDGRTLTFEVSDDGLGYDPQRTPIGAGMQNMSDRIGALGGAVRIDSTPGRGVRVLGELPLA
jgi:signal transduction histidine kinase